VLAGAIIVYRGSDQRTVRVIARAIVAGAMVLLVGLALFGVLISFLMPTYSVGLSGMDARDPEQRVRMPTAPIQCSANLPDLMLGVAFAPQLQTQDEAVFQIVQLNGKGFTPGEILNLFLKGEGQRHRVELALNQTVAADGTFAHDETVQWKEPKLRWQGFVVHQRGVACASVTGN